jgi:hypothetical protein
MSFRRVHDLDKRAQRSIDRCRVGKAVNEVGLEQRGGRRRANIIVVLARRIPTPGALAAEIAIYQRRRNAAAQPIEWTFTCDKARLKLHRLYPSDSS